MLTHGWLVVLIVALLSDPITPSLRGGFLFERIPGNKLPSNHHLVPPGQTHLRPYVGAHARICSRRLASTQNEISSQQPISPVS